MYQLYYLRPDVSCILVSPSPPLASNGVGSAEEGDASVIPRATEEEEAGRVGSRLPVHWLPQTM